MVIKGTHTTSDHPLGMRTDQAMAGTDHLQGREGPMDVPTGLTGIPWTGGILGIDMIGRGFMGILEGEGILGLKVLNTAYGLLF